MTAEYQNDLLTFCNNVDAKYSDAETRLKFRKKWQQLSFEELQEFLPKEYKLAVYIKKAADDYRMEFFNTIDKIPNAEQIANYKSYMQKQQRKLFIKK